MLDIQCSFLSNFSRLSDSDLIYFLKKSFKLRQFILIFSLYRGVTKVEIHGWLLPLGRFFDCQALRLILVEFTRILYRRRINSSMVDSIRNKNLKKITIAESKHWDDLGNYEKALGIVDESWGIEDDVWIESDWQQWRYNIINNGVDYYCEKRNFPAAKILAMKAADDLNVEGIELSLTFEANELSMRQILFAKIVDFEKILK